MSGAVLVNARVLQSHVTGVQRYTSALIECFGDQVEALSPQRWSSGIRGHAWEQFMLPAMSRRKVLFSPSNTGPLAVSQQVVTLHDVVPLDHPEWLNPKFAAWYRFLTPRLVRRVAHVITISEFSKERLLTHAKMDESRVTVIPNGVDARFRPLPQEEAFGKLKVLSLPSPNYVLCVGSLEPRKNLVRLLHAWSRIQANIPSDIWLVLTGKRGNARVFSDAAGLDALPPRVHLTGHVPDDVLPALYAGALLFAYPSVYEGFGLPPLEAMAAGVPVLAGNKTSLPEVMGDAGLMVDPYDVDALAEALERMIGDSALRSELSAKGVARSRQFSWDATAGRTWSVLMGVAGG